MRVTVGSLMEARREKARADLKRRRDGRMARKRVDWLAGQP